MYFLLVTSCPIAGSGIFISINASGTEIEDFRNAAADLAVALDRGEAEEVCDSMGKRFSLAGRQSQYHKSFGTNMKPAPVDASIASV